jgi:hypothetical protein
MAAGAADVATAWRTSGSLDDLTRTQTPRAHAQAANATVHHRADALQIRFETARRDIVRVADIPADDRSFSAKFATFCHD